MSKIIQGKRPDGPTLFAAVDGGVSYVQGKVAELRFASLLSPFKSSAEAEAALTAAGASLEGGAK